MTISSDGDKAQSNLPIRTDRQRKERITARREDNQRNASSQNQLQFGNLLAIVVDTLWLVFNWLRGGDALGWNVSLVAICLAIPKAGLFLLHELAMFLLGSMLRVY